MTRITLPCLLATFALLAAPLVAAEKIDLRRKTPVSADQSIPTQDFFRPLALNQPSLNRAGTHIAAITSGDDDKHLLLVYDIATTKSESLEFAGDRDIYNLHWLTDSRVLFQVSSLKMYGLGIMAANIGNLSDSYPLQQYTGASLVSIPLKKPASPVVWNRRDFETQTDQGVAVLNSQPRGANFYDLTASLPDYVFANLRAKVRENNQRSILHSYPTPPGLTYRYLADQEGELAYAFTADAGNLSLYRLENKTWARSPANLEEMEIIANANEPGQLLVIGPARDGKPSPLQLMNAATGAPTEIILQDPHYDFNGWTYHDPSTGSVLGAVFQKSGPRVYWFNEQYQSLQKVFDGMFPQQIVRIIGSNDRHEVFLLATYSDRQPASYHWVNLATRKAGLFKNSTPWIDPTRMQPMQILPFKTRDGHRLDAYLTLPAGTSKTNPAPLVVLCHGGPWARDNWGYSGEVQFLVHRGYAVLQPNYRGSTGSIGRFPAGDQYDFIKMHHDVTDAVKSALSTGLVDRERVGIMGSSFGGYLAISGVAHESDLYRCAVTNAGVFDWEMQLQAERYDQYDLPYYGRMLKTLGDPQLQPEKYAAMSPLRHVEKIRAPIFVAAGKDDEVVEVRQSRKLVAALEKHGVPHEKLFIGGEGHGMAHLKNEVEYYDRAEAFLARYLKSNP